MIALINSDSRHIPLADQSVQCVITSPPYWGLRSYNTGDNKHLEIGAEKTPQEYVASIVSVMREAWRVLRDDGVLWLNLGDSYAANRGNGASGIGAKQATNVGANLGKLVCPDGLKPKDLVGIPWRVAFALQDDGWYLRSDIIWSKSNPMPESVTDRPTKAHEYVFLLSKEARYYYDAEAIAEQAISGNGGCDTSFRGNGSNRIGRDFSQVGTSGQRNRRSVWTVATSPYSGAHYATFPPALVEPMVLAGTSQRGECPVCGRAWVRVVDRNKIKVSDSKRYSGNGDRNGSEDGRYESESTTLGWRSQCDHDADPVPQIVLDPFCGSGTVGQVCRESFRNFIGLDLSSTYLTDNAMPRAQRTNTAQSISTLPMFQDV